MVGHDRNEREEPRVDGKARRTLAHQILKRFQRALRDMTARVPDPNPNFLAVALGTDGAVLGTRARFRRVRRRDDESLPGARLGRILQMVCLRNGPGSSREERRAIALSVSPFLAR